MSEATPANGTADPGLKILIQGKSGSGKTTTFVEILKNTDLEVFLLFTEPAIATVKKAIREHALTEAQLKRLHWASCHAGQVGFKSLQDRAKKINTLSFQSLASLGDIDKQKYDQFYQLLGILSDYTDQNGTHFGSVDTWDNQRVLFLDSLSGLNIMAMDLVAGGKPAKNVSDWGIAQDNLRRLIQQLTMGCQCWMVLTAHVEQERDEVTGRIELMPATLGRKLAPEIPFFFDEVVFAYTDGKEYLISNAEDKIAVKHRAFPHGGKLKFSQVIGPVYKTWAQG